MVDKTTIQRLSFIKYIYGLGIEQSRQVEPLGSVSILSFHDSIELFLQLAAEQFSIATQNINFMDYWDKLKPYLPNGELTQRESMRRLNKCRVSLKHHGTLPSNLDIEAFRVSATNFFEENTPLIFGIEFGSISMVNLVRCDRVHKKLEESRKLIDENEIEGAITQIAISFSELIDDYEERKLSRFGRSPFFFGESLTFESSFFLHIEDRGLARYIDKVKNSIEAMREAMKVLSLGIDYRRYVKFRLLTPYVMKMASGRTVAEFDGIKPLPNVDDCNYCYDFVISSAIQLQEFDFEVNI